MTESSYERDPRVRPVHVEKLGKHHPVSSAGIPDACTPSKADSNAAADERAGRIDRGPTYDDFLEHDVAQTDLSDAAG